MIQLFNVKREFRCQSSTFEPRYFYSREQRQLVTFQKKKIIEREANESSSLMFQDPQVLQSNGRSSSSL